MMGRRGLARERRGRRGFTLVELSFAMVFIGILSITIVLIINDTVKTYQRGLTLNKINTVGMDLVDDMRAAVQNSSSRSVVSDCRIAFGGGSTALSSCEGDGGRQLVSVAKTARVQMDNDTVLTDVPVYGAFCTGSYTYIWNSGYYFGEGEYPQVVAPIASFTYRDDSGTKKTLTNFRLLKVKDNSRGVCLTAVGEGYNTNNLNGFDVSGSGYAIAVGEPPVELLPNDENDTGLAIYDLSAEAPAESSASNSLFYSVSFILGTVRGGINIMASGDFCATPSDYELGSLENFDYCAINKFNFAVQATGE